MDSFTSQITDRLLTFDVDGLLIKIFSFSPSFSYFVVICQIESMLPSFLYRNLSYAKEIYDIDKKLCLCCSCVVLMLCCIDLHIQL